VNRYERLLHFRFWLGCTVVALIPTALLMWLWHPLRWSFWLFLPAVVAVSVMEGGPVAYVCPHCRKRVKAGAATCHHCGRDVLPA
jgi:hypothetical protein